MQKKRERRQFVRCDHRFAVQCSLQGCGARGEQDNIRRDNSGFRIAIDEFDSISYAGVFDMGSENRSQSSIHRR